MKKTVPTFVIFIFFILSILACGTVYSQKITKEAAIKKAEYYLNTLQVFYADGAYETHKKYSDSLLSIAISHDLTKMHILALSNQAIFYKNQGKQLKAIELYHKALEKCELLPKDYRSKIIVLVNMGNTYKNIGFYDKSIEKMKQVLFMLDSYEDSPKIRAAALIGIANAYSELGDYYKDIEYATKAMEIAEQIGNQNIMITSLSNISDSYTNLKQYNKALAYSNKALALSQPEKRTKRRAWLLLNTGRANYYLKKRDTAFHYLNEALVLAKEKKIIEIEMYAYETLALLYEENKDYQAYIEAQKAYNALKDQFLKDKKDASNTDLNTEITKKNNKLKDVIATNTTLTIVGLITLLVLSFVLFFYSKRKKKLDNAQAKLRKQYRELQRDYTDYKTKTQASLEKETIPNNDTLKPYKNSSLTPEKREEIKSLLLAFMKKEKPFLNSELTQLGFAKKLNISSHHFSEVLYYNFEQNFYNFINSYRVLEAQRLIKKDKDIKILAVAFDSGFKSKTSFNRIFKAHTGLTPSEYRRKHTE